MTIALPQGTPIASSEEADKLPHMEPTNPQDPSTSASEPSGDPAEEPKKRRPGPQPQEEETLQSRVAMVMIAWAREWGANPSRVRTLGKAEEIIRMIQGEIKSPGE